MVQSIRITMSAYRKNDGEINNGIKFIRNVLGTDIFTCA